jgi:hypothetical protein
MSDNLPCPSGFNSNEMFDWIEDMPQPKMSRGMQKEQVQQLHHAAGALPYRGRWDAVSRQYVIDDPRFVGATYFEVMIMKKFDRAVEGDAKAESEIMDRVLGKPKQAMETVSMNMTFEDFLLQSAIESAKETPVQEDTGFYDVQAEPVEDDIDNLDELLEGV